jgi:hypothetical protein
VGRVRLVPKLKVLLTEFAVNVGTLDVDAMFVSVPVLTDLKLLTQ